MRGEVLRGVLCVWFVTDLVVKVGEELDQEEGEGEGGRGEGGMTEQVRVLEKNGFSLSLSREFLSEINKTTPTGWLAISSTPLPSHTHTHTHTHILLTLTDTLAGERSVSPST